MTDGRSGRIANWVAIAVSVLILVGSGATAYSDLSASILEMRTRDIATQKQLGKLDEYDARISENVDELGDRMIRSESEQVSIKRTQERIEFTMSEMLKEMKQMNENIIRLDR